MIIKAFISWSGDLSCKLAEEFHSWLPKVLQSVKPYFSPNDLEKGVKWDSEMSKELDISHIGLLCLTHENMDKPWILFEAGALSTKMGKAKVCPILFGFEPAELKGPLATFQSTRFTKDDFKKLISTINNSSEDMRLESKYLDEVFEVWWPKLDEKVKGIMSSHKAGPKKDPRTERDILIEILELTRMLAKPQNPFEVDNQALREVLASSIFKSNWATGLGSAFEEFSKNANAQTRNLAETIRTVVDQFNSAPGSAKTLPAPSAPAKKE